MVKMAEIIRGAQEMARAKQKQLQAVCELEDSMSAASPGDRQCHSEEAGS